MFHQCFAHVYKNKNYNIKKEILNGDLDTVKKIYELTDIPKKQLVHLACSQNNVALAQWLYDKTEYNPTVDKDFTPEFNSCCKKGFVQMAQWLYQKDTTHIEPIIDKLFLVACHYNQLPMAKWLYSTGKVENNLQRLRFIYNTLCFQHDNDALELIQWLIASHNYDIRLDDDYLFCVACKWTNLDYMNWLCSLCSDYSFEEVDFEIRPIIIRPIDKAIQKQEWSKVVELANICRDPTISLDKCYICYEDGNCITNCNHTFCIRCLITWHNKLPTCAYCRREIRLDQCKTNLSK